MLTFLIKLWHHTGRRGTFLLFWSFLWISTGYRWIEEPPVSDNYISLFRTLPSEAWGWIFMATGLIMGLGAHFKKLDYISFAVSAYISAFVGTMVLLGYLPGIPGPADTGFTVALTYFLYTIFVLVIAGWPEDPSQRRAKDGS